MTDDRGATLLAAAATIGIGGEELNATPVTWPPGAGTADGAIAERELLLVVMQGTATATVDGCVLQLAAHDSLLIPAGASWQMVAGEDGMHYLSVHRRKGPIALGPPPE